MTALEQIRALALQGIGRAGVEATVGHKLDATELAAFHKAATVRKLKKSAAKSAASSADRVAKFVATRNEVGEIPT